jgi:glycerophosphoryl diester phosphodiesterase/CTP:molybdopterin cytidylyltransferase MocA
MAAVQPTGLSTVAILPAAGASRRMGRAKLLLPLRGRPLIAGVVEALRGGGVKTIVVVTSSGDEELRAWARAAGLTVAVNADPERGMLSSIREGVAAAGGAAELARRGTTLLVSPADLPNLRAATVSALLQRMATNGAPIAVPVYRGKRGHPLAIAPALIPELDALDPQVGLKQLRDRHAAELLEVEVEDPGVVQDVDTPEDYRRLALPIVIAHRGASGYRPEHTLAAYDLAIDLGADFIEPDLVATKDGVLIARHENEISETTDVAERPEFASRRTSRRIDGREVDGWFTEDFTLAEIKTLRAKERLPFRNQEYNGRFEVPTFQEVLDLARRRSVGVYPETKHPTYFRSLGLPLEEPLLAIFDAACYRDRNAPVFVQSFETGNLKELRKKTEVPLIQLLETGQPYNLTEIATYADGIGPDKRLIVPADDAGRLQTPTSLVEDAHRTGLLVHPWTFRSDPEFLASGYEGDPEKEYDQFFSLGVDGVFSDFADTAIHAREHFIPASRR